MAVVCSFALLACSRTSLDADDERDAAGEAATTPAPACHDFRVPSAASCAPGPTATTLFDEPIAGSSGFAVDDVNVYFSDVIDNVDIVQTLHAMPKCGGAAKTLASGVRGPLFVRGGFVYGRGSDGLVRVSVNGGPVEHFGSPDFAMTQLALDDASLFTVAQDTTSANVVAYSLADRVTKVLAPSAPRYFSSLAVDCATLFFTVGMTNYRTHLESVAKTGGPTTTLTPLAFDAVNGLEMPGPIAIDDDFLYWVRLDSELLRVKKDGTEIVTLANDVPTLIAIDDTDVYFLSRESTEIERVPKVGGPPTLVASTANVQAIALDRSAAYWVEGGSLEGYRIQTQAK